MSSKEITIGDCLSLLDEFYDFAEEAEQRLFPTLFMVNMLLETTIDKWLSDGAVEQKEARCMFRTVFKIIGRDYSEYLEPEAN